MKPFIGDLLLVAVLVYAMWEGENMDKNPKNYSCPSYCEADHKHFFKQDTLRNKYAGNFNQDTTIVLNGEGN